MSSVETEKQAFVTVTQIVYKAVFEGTEMFREITEKQAEKRRAEEIAREKRAAERTDEPSVPQTSPPGLSSPSVIVDFQSSAAAKAAGGAPPPEGASTVVPHAVNVLA